MHPPSPSAVPAPRELRSRGGRNAIAALVNRLLLALFLLLCAFPAHAQLPPRPEGDVESGSSPRRERPAAGSTVTLAFVMRPEPGWHGYWRNPGDAGAEPRIAWRLPDGLARRPAAISGARPADRRRA